MGFTPWQASPVAPEAATTEEADVYVPSVVLILNIYTYTQREIEGKLFNSFWTSYYIDAIGHHQSSGRARSTTGLLPAF